MQPDLQSWFKPLEFQLLSCWFSSSDVVSGLLSIEQSVYLACIEVCYDQLQLYRREQLDRMTVDC